jgi:putative addiction module component (TIGR02574 family)
MDTTLLETAKKLPLADQVVLAEALWENIAEQGYDPELSPAQAAELDRRLEEYHKHPETGIPWEQVKAELEKKYGQSA